jgi:hypothetical protein
MTITFDIKDTIGTDYIAAAKWSLNKPAAKNEDVMAEHLQGCIASLIDSHKKHQVLGKDESSINNMRDQVRNLERQLMDAEMQFHDRKRDYETTVKSTDVKEVAI